MTAIGMHVTFKGASPETANVYFISRSHYLCLLASETRKILPDLQSFETVDVKDNIKEVIKNRLAPPHGAGLLN